MLERRHGSCQVSLFSLGSDVSPSASNYCIRLGSCGAFIDIPVGSVVVPKASVAVTRNVDFDFLSPEDCADPPYRISKPVSFCASGSVAID